MVSSIRLAIALAITLSAFPHHAIGQTAIPAGAPPEQFQLENGIYVGQPKVYDDRSLQQLLTALRARLALLTGTDQASLLARLGSLQGASSSQSQLSLQATTLPVPGSTTTMSSGSPSVVQTVGSSTSNASAGPSFTGSNQTVTTNPGATTQLQTTAPAVTPGPSALPSSTAPSFPSVFSTSSLDTLNEQMQLSYELINLQMLLQGSLNDEYVAGTHLARKHTTIGFPISILTPPDKRFRNAVAEIEVTVCNPDLVDDFSPPSLMTILPREKTYNVASIVSKSTSLGVGAVIGGIINIGASFLSGSQKYYLVKDQDTVALQRRPRLDVCTPFQRDGESIPSVPVTFAWQFRPVLGQHILQPGLRQTFAQISFAAGPRNPSKVRIVSRWRHSCAKTGVVGDDVDGSAVQQTETIETFFAAPYIQGVSTLDNRDGTMTVTVDGHFLPGSRIRIGENVIDESTATFQNTLSFLRFTAPSQAIALKGASLAGRDGAESELLAPEQQSAYDVPVKGAVTLKTFSDTLIEVTVPIDPAQPNLPTGGPYPRVVVLGSKSFGLSDAPFRSETQSGVSFLAPKELLAGQVRLLSKRLFLGKSFAEQYQYRTLRRKRRFRDSRFGCQQEAHSNSRHG